MTDTVFYADSFPPTKWDSIVGNQPEWEAALSSVNYDPNFTAISYSLYQDTSTFEDWLTWAYDNRLTTNDNDQNYDGAYVLGMIGTWPELTGEDSTYDDLMCIVDAATTESDRKGAICIQTDKANSLTKTYKFTAADFKTFLTAFLAADTDGQELDYSTEEPFVSGTDEAINTTDGVFEGFQKFYCEDYSTGVQLECRAWSRATAVNIDSVDYGEIDGYPRWVDKETVFFFWVDRSSTTSN